MLINAIETSSVSFMSISGGSDYWVLKSVGEKKETKYLVIRLRVPRYIVFESIKQQTLERRICSNGMGSFSAPVMTAISNFPVTFLFLLELLC